MSQSFPEMFARSARRKDPARRRRHLNRLAANTDELDFAPGQIIVRKDDPGEALFVVLSGEGKVMRGGRKVGEVVLGDCFGEL